MPADIGDAAEDFRHEVRTWLAEHLVGAYAELGTSNDLGGSGASARPVQRPAEQGNRLEAPGGGRPQ